MTPKEVLIEAAHVAMKEHIDAEAYVVAANAHFYSQLNQKNIDRAIIAYNALQVGRQRAATTKQELDWAIGRAIHESSKDQDRETKYGPTPHDER